jgi:hypothetical protein
VYNNNAFGTIINGLKLQLSLRGCKSDFYCYDKMPEISKLKGGKIYFGSWF